MLFRKDCGEPLLFYVRLSLTARRIVSIPSLIPQKSTPLVTSSIGQRPVKPVQAFAY
jgi:hypothetical protein